MKPHFRFIYGHAGGWVVNSWMWKDFFCEDIDTLYLYYILNAKK